MMGLKLLQLDYSSDYSLAHMAARTNVILKNIFRFVQIFVLY